MAGQNSDQKNPDQISDEIRQTRANMRRTLDALETKLSPARLKQEATSTIRNQTVGRVEDIADSAGRTMKGASADVFETIRENPLPAALAAIGIGWLFMESRGEGRRQAPMTSRRGGEYEYGYRYYERPGEFDRSSRPMQEATGQMRETAGQMRDTAGQMADQARDRANQVAGQAQEKAAQVAGQAHDQMEEWAGAAQEQVGRVRSRLEDAIDTNPLLVGAAAVALGAAIGMSLPQTPQEDKMMGQARDTLMDKAQSTAKETMDKVQQVAEKAGTAAKETAKDEAQKQNLTS